MKRKIRSRGRKMSILGGIPYDTYLKSIAGVDWFMTQELSGSVALATNSALALGRDLLLDNNPMVDSANWVKGVGWTISAGKAHCDGSQVATSTLAQGLVPAISRTYEITYTVSNYVSGTIQGIFGGQVGATNSGNDIYTDEITATSTGFFRLSASSTFVGSVNVDSIKQTGILASSEYAPGTNPMDGANTALTVGVPSTSSDVGYLYSGNATTAVLDLYSAELNSKISWDNGGAMMVAQVDTWSPGIDVLFRLAVDADNESYILRSETSLIWVYEQTTTQSIYTLANADAILGTDEFTIGISWDVAGVGMQAYLKGAQQGTDQSIAAAIIGNLDSTMAVMFANASTAGNSWAGDGSRLGIGYRTLTAGEHSDYYTRSGL